MNDYSKWDKLDDSDEDDDRRERQVRAFENEAQETMLGEQEAVEKWLKLQETFMERSQRNSTSNGPDADHGYVPELSESAEYRRLTAGERKTIAMFIVVCHFEDGTTNLDRHRQILDLVAHNRWLEEDPGTLELLCRAHNQSMRLSGPGKNPQPGREPEQDAKIRSQCFSCINALAAPRECNCPGGLLELINQICTPLTETARDHRKKWQKKEFGKTAIFNSLFPDLRKAKQDADSGWTDILLLGGMIVLIVVVVAILFWGPALPLSSPSQLSSAAISLDMQDVISASSTSGESITTTAGQAMVAGAAGGAIFNSGGDTGPGMESSKKIEELQRQIEELKRLQKGADFAKEAALAEL